jgi:hypothetical protein
VQGQGLQALLYSQQAGNHSYEECCANLRNQARYNLCTNNSNKKRRHESHFNNNCYTSSDDESRRSVHTPMPSNGDASASGESKAKENFNLNEGKKNKKNGSCLMCLFPCALARAVRSIVFQTSISIGMKCSKMPLSQMLKLQTSKRGFKLKTCLHLTNDGLR